MCKIFKSFAKKSTEEKAALATLIGMFGAIFGSLIGEFWVKSLVFDALFTGLFCVVYVVGCVVMCVMICGKTSEKLPKVMAFAAFGFAAALVTELMVDWVALHLFGVELPMITAWYAFPAFAIIIGSIIALAIGACLDRRRT